MSEKKRRIEVTEHEVELLYYYRQLPWQLQARYEGRLIAQVEEYNRAKAEAASAETNVDPLAGWRRCIIKLGDRWEGEFYYQYFITVEPSRAI